MIFEWTEKEKKPRFAELKIGDVFYLEDDRSVVYMRISEVSNEVNDFNAVDFSDGTLTYFYPHEEVEKVKAKMVLS